MIILANTLFSQELFYTFNSSTKTTAVAGKVNILSHGYDIGTTFILGGARSSYGSFFTSDKGVQTKTQLGGNATKVLFGFNICDGYFSMTSGTEVENEIVKAQASKTTFNGGTETSIFLHIGDFFYLENVKLGVGIPFKLISFDEKLDELTIEVQPATTTTTSIIDEENIVLPEYVEHNKEKYLVTEILQNAFSGCTNLKSVIIGENVTSIGENAFAGCSALSKITCFAVNPPEVDASSFSNYNGYLTIPCDNFEAYDIHPIWGNFKHIECISAESTELPKDEVVVEPEINEAVFSMPTNASANSYTLTIQNNGVTFCTLTFNSQGQLSNIDFSGNTLKASVEGYQFTVTGLSAATDYGYSFKALDKSKSVLKEYTGSFTTKNEDGTGGSSAGGVGTSISDVLDFVDIQVVNNQIYVDGSIVPYVIDIQGKKITNKNLKAGVYFLLIDGKTFSVSIQ